MFMEQLNNKYILHYKLDKKKKLNVKKKCLRCGKFFDNNIKLDLAVRLQIKSSESCFDMT